MPEDKLSNKGMEAISEALLLAEASGVSADDSDTDDETTDEVENTIKALQYFTTSEDSTLAAVNIISSCPFCGNLFPYPIIITQLDVQQNGGIITEESLPLIACTDHKII